MITEIQENLNGIRRYLDDTEKWLGETRSLLASAQSDSILLENIREVLWRDGPNTEWTSDTMEEIAGLAGGMPQETRK